MGLEIDVYKKSNAETIFYFPSSYLDDVVNLLSRRIPKKSVFTIKVISKEHYWIYNEMGDFFGRVIKENNFNSFIQLLNLPPKEHVEEDINEIEKILMGYGKSLKKKKRKEKRKKYFIDLEKTLDGIWDAGWKEVKERKPFYTNPNLLNSGFDFAWGSLKFIYNSARKRSK